jgi:hypothetical protein
VRIFKYSWFARFARKEAIEDGELKSIVRDVLETGQAEASLGGDVYKVRIARTGEGKSGGYRVIVYFKSQFRTFFVYGFEKSARANIGQGELQAFKDDAREDFSLTDEQIKAWLKNGSLLEIF